jgi:hypothetical protein
MRTVFVSALVLYCGAQGACASLAPPTRPCPDTEREFVELTLAHLVRQGRINARDLIAYRAPNRTFDACPAPPSESVRVPAAGVAGGT